MRLRDLCSPCASCPVAVSVVLPPEGGPPHPPPNSSRRHLSLPVSPPHRPCCSKSDDFYTFGSIFLEKGFEREVRTSEQPQEQGQQGLGWGAGAGHRAANTPRRPAQGGRWGVAPAATGVGTGLSAACLGSLLIGLAPAPDSPVSGSPTWVWETLLPSNAKPQPVLSGASVHLWLCTF